jgi:hypothetical protein
MATEIDDQPFDPYEDYSRDEDEDRDEEVQLRREFAEPGGRSALRAASASNPRNLPCPTCKKPNRLTPKDRALGYQCNECADRDEGCGP